MIPRLIFLPAVTIFALLFQSRITAQQRWTDGNGYTYEVYDVYPQGYYPQQQQQRQRYLPQQQELQYTPQSSQQYYSQQQTASVSVAEAKWVCTNTRTKDMMVFAAEDVPRVFEGQTHQPNYLQQQQSYQQQPNYPLQLNYPQQPPNYPQQPSYPQQPNYNPQQPNYPQQVNYPNQHSVELATTTTTTTEEPRPIWPSADNYNNQPNQPSVYSTTQKSPVWPVGDKGNKPGFTISEGIASPPVTPTKPTSNPIRPGIEPAKPLTQKPDQKQNDPNDYDDIEIVMGKK